MTNIRHAMEPGDALIIVDVQNDFCPGGLLPIKDGHMIVPVINQWIEAAVENNIPVYVSRDWHPVGHLSFKDSGGLWPPHCIQDSDGARFHPNLKLPDSAIMITKGVRFDQDQNSVFDQTGFAFKLKKDGIKRLLVSGLAEDVCVLATVTDACKEGFETILIANATKPVTQKGGKEARQKMQDAGVNFV
ncbi:MAG: isochorismatase family protein [Pseudomonadota bacterium]